MRNSLLFSLLSLSLITTSLLGQPFQQGMHYLGGGGNRNLLYNSNIGAQSDQGEFGLAVGEGGVVFLNVAPEYGYFLTDRLVVGAGAIFAVTTDFDVANAAFGVLPFGRYYLNEVDADWRWFGQLSTGFILNDDSENIYPFSLALGTTHMLAPGVGLDAALVFTDSDLATEENSSLGISAGLNFYLDQAPGFRARMDAPAFSAGALMIGGSTGGFSFNLADGSNYSFSLSPTLHYFLNDRIALGAGLSFWVSQFQSSGFFGSLEGQTVEFSLSPQVRYYLSNDGRSRTWFLGTGFSIDYSRVRNDSSFSGRFESANTDVNFAVTSGFNQFLTPNIALEAGPSLRIDPSNELIRIGFDLGVQVFLRN